MFAKDKEKPRLSHLGMCVTKLLYWRSEVFLLPESDFRQRSEIVAINTSLFNSRFLVRTWNPTLENLPYIKYDIESRVRLDLYNLIIKAHSVLDLYWIHGFYPSLFWGNGVTKNGGNITRVRLLKSRDYAFLDFLGSMNQVPKPWTNIIINRIAQLILSTSVKMWIRAIHENIFFRLFLAWN